MGGVVFSDVIFVPNITEIHLLTLGEVGTDVWIWWNHTYQFLCTKQPGWERTVFTSADIILTRVLCLILSYESVLFIELNINRNDTTRFCEGHYCKVSSDFSARFAS